jgi:isopentenyl-diphosphate delta-isomerase
MTRRALGKRTWPGVWTNAFCGHPAPGEALADAVRRRATFELGITVDVICCALSDFGYVARDASGIEENEHCPVFIARIMSPLSPNPAEVAETQWTTVRQLDVALDSAPWAFSPWLVEHFHELIPHFASIAAEPGDHD